MQLLDWSLLDAVQTGALVTLAGAILLDALSRRDRMMAWLGLACLLVGGRHAALALAGLPTLNPDLLDRFQSVLVSTGFIALCAAVRVLFPEDSPRRFPEWIAAAMLTNVYRNLFAEHPSSLDTWLHHATNATYLAGCGLIVLTTLRARLRGNPMGQRLFYGCLGLTLPVVVEIAAQSLFDLKIRLSGVSIVILTVLIGTSRHWLLESSVNAQLRDTEDELRAWRSLMPGQTFRTGERSPAMEALFGPRWADRVRSATTLPVVGSDGVTYRLRSQALESDRRVGWFERTDETQPGRSGFLGGWTVGLGIDDPAECARIQALLQAWGATVQLWGTVPPREEPYPSVLIWAREPSILTVWREHDLLRRRTRWIQVGGPITEGPHARLQPGPTEAALRQLLDDLLSRH